jgi:hypothetical protein
MGAVSDRFTIADYESMLRAARAGGYAFGRFTDPEPAPEARVLYLRHDIDNCIESALLMAELEASVGAVSTYLVMVRSENYNPFAAENVRRLRRVRALGHEVGLHFSAEEHTAADLEADLAGCVLRDARLLEEAVGAPVRVFSFHNPGEAGDYAVQVPTLVNAYADRFFARARYLSESNMRWAHGAPVDLLRRGEDRIVQILVHPLSFRGDFTSDRDVLLWFIADTVRRLLALNVGQNRVLREAGLSVADVAAYLALAEAGAGGP